METILEIRISHDGRRMVAWDPNAESELASVSAPVDADFPGAERMGNLLKILAGEVAQEWLEIEAAG